MRSRSALVTLRGATVLVLLAMLLTAAGCDSDNIKRVRYHTHSRTHRHTAGDRHADPDRHAHAGSVRQFRRRRGG